MKGSNFSPAREGGFAKGRQPGPCSSSTCCTFICDYDRWKLWSFICDYDRWKLWSLGTQSTHLLSLFPSPPSSFFLLLKAAGVTDTGMPTLQVFRKADSGKLPAVLTAPKLEQGSGAAHPAHVPSPQLLGRRWAWPPPHTGSLRASSHPWANCVPRVQTLRPPST